ncbi:ABC transporter ATP-binding protein [Nonomuraea jabiensis]|uniref:Glycerol transport system ATP-binding protein n=1 Tax=Nonomuraea jabiensis TaxID=882448 RepID=A0A7W9G5V7_9ACTN|nr:ABC transporter ATP-binding protein [Nonomuraea jabiensis]MBB5777693.1 glycerol transport system ATP-binding protein [Nonomuraea jabiensis]
MADIRLEGVGHSYDGGQTWALKPMTWTWQSARAYALLGPSGCGKTTLLNIISGLLTPTVGRIFFDDRDVTDVPTSGRNIAQVFQFPVLYEEMSVYDNLAFPLRNRKYPKKEIDERVRQVSRLLGLDQLLGRRSRRLDAGRQQIVSLGRGLVRSQVAAVLLDEPLTVVDPALKWTLRSKLKEIHRDTGHTLVYVTHDQTEALTFADEVVVLNDGAIVQAGEPAELFLSPAHEFVGHFIGSPGMNMLPAEIVGDVVRVGQADVGLVAGLVAGELPPGPVRIGVRPEFVEITGAGRSPGVAATVTGIDRMGAYDLVHARVGEHPVIARTGAGSPCRPGAVEFLHFPADRTFLFRDEVRCGSLAPLNGRGTA